MKPERETLELKDILKNVLEESRMVLPGIQALFGFQLVAVFNSSFKEIPAANHVIHLVALMLTICSVACLMAPASYHRQVQRDEVTSEFVEYASKLICIGMMPLMLSITLDTYVVADVITHSSLASVGVACGAFIVLSTLWYGVPTAHRFARKQGKLADSMQSEKSQLVFKRLAASSNQNMPNK